MVKPFTVDIFGPDNQDAPAVYYDLVRRLSDTVYTVSCVGESKVTREAADRGAERSRRHDIYAGWLTRRPFTRPETEELTIFCKNCKFYGDSLNNNPECDNNGATDSAEAEREAKRVAAIAEAANIIRTLNSHKCRFEVVFSFDCVIFTFLDGWMLNDLSGMGMQNLSLWRFGVGKSSTYLEKTW